MVEPVIWICRCGKLETPCGREAFQHRNQFGSDNHVVKPVRESEIVRAEPALTGIELRELEQMVDAISPLSRGIRE